MWPIYHPVGPAGIRAYRRDVAVEIIRENRLIITGSATPLIRMRTPAIISVRPKMARFRNFGVNHALGVTGLESFVRHTRRPPRNSLISSNLQKIAHF